MFNRRLWTKKQMKQFKQPTNGRTPKNELEKMKDQIQKPVWNRSISADVQWFLDLIDLLETNAKNVELHQIQAWHQWLTICWQSLTYGFQTIEHDILNMRKAVSPQLLHKVWTIRNWESIEQRTLDLPKTKQTILNLTPHHLYVYLFLVVLAIQKR